MISPEERRRREQAVRFARNSVRLEGFILSEEAEALNQRYIDGELTRAEYNAAIFALAGLPGSRNSWGMATLNNPTRVMNTSQTS